LRKEVEGWMEGMNEMDGMKWKDERKWKEGIYI
jgi:hypothetical protein